MPDFFPDRRRLRHDVPGWVEESSWFFITVNCTERGTEQLTLPSKAESLLNSARFYHEQGRWHLRLFLLMPDHWHAIMALPLRDEKMVQVLRDWKRYTARTLRVQWQDGFFDHRLRNPEEVAAKFDYIQRNPVVLNLIQQTQQWPHQLRYTPEGLITGGTTTLR